MSPIAANSGTAVTTLTPGQRHQPQRVGVADRVRAEKLIDLLDLALMSSTLRRLALTRTWPPPPAARTSSFAPGCPANIPCSSRPSRDFIARRRMKELDH
jgi:hypothetical protein